MPEPKSNYEQLTAPAERLDQISETIMNPPVRADVIQAARCVSCLASLGHAVEDISHKLTEFMHSAYHDAKVSHDICIDVEHFAADLLAALGYGEEF
jgi:hypothetical protein